MSGHQLQWHNYKTPTMCDHCGDMLMGLIKQGLRCKRCEVDVHQKCQEDLTKPCVRLMKGQHNFRPKTYKQMTYCDFCGKLLIGLINQGLRCSECFSNVHEKCREKIDRCVGKNPQDMIEQVGQARPVSPLTIQMTEIQSYQRRPSNEPIDPNLTNKFDQMPSKTIPTPSPVDDAAEQSSPKQLTQLDNMVDEVIDKMRENTEKIVERGDNIEKLEKTAREVEENSRIFVKNTEDVTKKMWYQNQKYKIIAIIAVAILILIIVIAIVLNAVLKKKK